MAKKKSKATEQPRRAFSKEFKQEAIGLSQRALSTLGCYVGPMQMCTTSRSKLADEFKWGAACVTSLHAPANFKPSLFLRCWWVRIRFKADG